MQSMRKIGDIVAVAGAFKRRKTNFNIIKGENDYDEQFFKRYVW
jgi:hypothetical protein